jgi:hypothetical protein
MFRRVSSGRSRVATSKRIDALICFLVLAGAIAYVAAWPHELNPADESYFLYESKRILEGEVLYRDVFYFPMPAAHWLMALIFGLFGVTIEVARSTMAVLHGLICAALYVAARRLAVGRPLSLTPPLAHLALCFAPWPYMSPHWFSTAVTIPLLLFVDRGVPRPRDAVVAGLVLGALTSIFQQKGVFLCLGFVAFVLVDAWSAGRFGVAVRARDAMNRMLLIAAGVLLVVVPVLVVMTASAGLEKIIDATIRFPMIGYRHQHHTIPWGSVSVMTHALAPYTSPAFLAYLPLVVGANAGRAAWIWLRGRDADRFRRQLGLAAVGAAAVGSILYSPDVIHLAFIAPLLLVSAAELLQLGAQRLDEAVGATRLPEWALAAGASVFLIAKAASNLERVWQTVTPYPSAFGRVDLANPRPAELLRRIDALLEKEPTREVFVYPACTFVYLMTDTDNPTPYQLLLPTLNPPEHHAEVVRALEARRTRYVVVCPRSMPDDPVLPYVEEHYECVEAKEAPCVIYRRRDHAAGMRDPHVSTESG